MSSRTIDPSTAAPSSAAAADGLAHPNPVCTEIGVSVQGSAHTAAGGQASQPFLEQTTTVIVFGQGAVVRLSESVTPGQILIVRHLRTNDEAACRVVSVKANPNVKGYVELEFLQPSPGFWGMDFPAASAAKTPSAVAAQSPAMPAAPAAPAAPAHAERAVSDPSRTQTIPRPGSPAPAVRSSVSAVDTSNTAAAAGMTFLPDLLDSLSLPTEIKRAPEPPRAENVRPASAPATKAPQVPWTSAPGAAKSDITKGTPAPGDGRYVSDLLDTLTPIGETILREKPKSVSPSATLSAAPAAPAISRPAPAAPAILKSTPVSYVEPSLADSALPTLAAEPAPLAVRASAHIVPSVSPEVAPLLSGGDVVAHGRLLGEDISAGKTPEALPKPMRILAIAAAIALVLAAGAGVYRWQKKSGPSTSVTAPSEPAPGVPAGATDTAASTAPPAASVAPAATAAAGASATESSKNSHSNAQPSTSAAAATPAKSSAPTATTTTPALPAARGAAVAGMKMAVPTVASHSADQATPTIASAVPSAAQNASAAGLLGESPSSGPAAPATRTSSGVTQPRLLNAPAPIYPYAARAEHVQGDVSVDLLIDETGKVASMTVLSGPALLRPAALDALKQRKYAPAMLDGKPTTSHIVVIVHFQI
jgi:TonB family protein